MVRAKFRCTSAQHNEYGQVVYAFYAAHGSEENKAWAKATPGGNLSITIDNPAAQVFEPGKHYFLDFTPAE